ncbi:MAG: Stk1 family PASTA domain-containing Ser/Thr kinase [Bacillota bacterium]|jgi:serine/threonine-protein kinase|nr:Stk1 family PASTA domain-containing Ser/Thr kinase [Bacillota bacterium]NLL27089.1 Stk1 family PASTA domain-containing Ser/Thr kinase [Erysipelotrichia bacterium]
MAEMIGNRYIVVKKIGEGGMADVYLAIDSILKREVAVKVLRGDLASDPVNLTRFKREALAITSTSHPNIVEVFDVGQHDGKHYIVMEYVHSKTLKQLIRSRGNIPIDEAVNIMKQLVSAVEHAHKMGIIHRDIKSQNVLVKDDGTVKLSDFGIASIVGVSDITKTDTVIGSVHYMAPELAQGQPVKVQSDIYSLGIVFYELLTGDVPYHSETAVEVALKHMHNDVPPVKNFNSQIPQSVENIVIRSTSRKVDLRYKTAMEMYNDLVTCLDLARYYEPKINLKEIEEKKKLEENKKHSKPQLVRKKKKNNTDYMNIFAIGGAGILAFIILFLLINLTNGLSVKKEKVKVPNVIMYSVEDAVILLESQGLRVENINYESTFDYDKGIVFSISPAVGVEVFKDSTVVLSVSLGKKFKVENYVGKDINTVKPLLEAAGFEVIVLLVESKDHKKDEIINQSLYEGLILDPTDKKIINFDVATDISFMIPLSIEGMDINEAKELLESMGAKVMLNQLNIEDNLDEDGNYIIPQGIVVSCSPVWGTYYVQTEGVVITLSYY